VPKRPSGRALAARRPGLRGPFRGRLLCRTVGRSLVRRARPGPTDARAPRSGAGLRPEVRPGLEPPGPKRPGPARSPKGERLGAKAPARRAAWLEGARAQPLWRALPGALARERPGAGAPRPEGLASPRTVAPPPKVWPPALVESMPHVSSLRLAALALGLEPRSPLERPARREGRASWPGPRGSSERWESTPDKGPTAGWRPPRSLPKGAAGFTLGPSAPQPPLAPWPS
jgi:hypothetical protein